MAGSGPYDCTNPTIPAGTPDRHTRILGRNYAHCDAANEAGNSPMTEIFGGHGVYAALNLRGAAYLDVQCLNITRHSQCIVHGSPAYPAQCRSSFPVDDYDSDGIQTDLHTHDILLQDLWIHGHTDRGILGPIGGEVNAVRVDIAYNGMAGWDLDDGNSTPSTHATLRLDHSTIEWSGCNQEYPAQHQYPAISCYGQSSGGYGDGIGTPAGMGIDVYIDHSTFRYNTQDGEDFGHVDSGSHTLHITNSFSYANSGGQFKWGPNFTSVVFENNLVLGKLHAHVRTHCGRSQDLQSEPAGLLPRRRCSLLQLPPGWHRHLSQTTPSSPTRRLPSTSTAGTQAAPAAHW